MRLRKRRFRVRSEGIKKDKKILLVINSEAGTEGALVGKWWMIASLLQAREHVSTPIDND